MLRPVLFIAYVSPIISLIDSYNIKYHQFADVGDFLLVIIELFSLGAFVLSQYTRLTDGQNLDSDTVRMLRSCTVMIFLTSYQQLLNGDEMDCDVLEWRWDGNNWCGNRMGRERFK